MTVAAPCGTCGFELFNPVAVLSVSAAGLYSDGRYPGRMIVSLNRHYDHFSEVPTDLLGSFFADVQRCAKALQSDAEVTRVNVAVLGNQEPHVHAHVIPRRGHSESWANHTPWESGIAHYPLDEADRVSLIEWLRSRI